MFPHVSKLALSLVVAALVSPAVGTAAEPKEAAGKTKSLPKELVVDLGKSVKLEMVLIPAGEFKMGSPDSDKNADPNEKPQHRVRITRPFYLGKYPIMQEQWEVVTGNNRSLFKGPRNPVETASWDECQQFLKKLNARLRHFHPNPLPAGNGEFRLPTEAQWEYACRAGSTTKYCFGDDESRLGQYAWYSEKADETHPVGKKKPNAWGLHDMHGNVWEWCQDWYDREYYARSSMDDPTGAAAGSMRVIRGNCGGNPAEGCRSANRDNCEPSAGGGYLGFRAALVLTDEAPTAIEPKPTPSKQITNSIGMKLTLVPSGEFMMGSKESAEETAAFFNKTYGGDVLNAGFFKGEHPQHRVRITKPFYLGTYHVTRGQFRQFVADTAYKTDAEKGERPGARGWDPEKQEFGFNEKYSWRNAGFEQTDEHPVVNVSWNDAVAFCKWLSKKESNTYRLPTEAEWEYACRAGTTTRFYSGDDPETLAKVGNVPDAAFKAQFPEKLPATFPERKYTIKASDGYVFTSPVGKFKPNAFGLYDMHGNAWQWCADRYGDYDKSPVDDPTGPDIGNFRVYRGGSWFNLPRLARSANRMGAVPQILFDIMGFRVARTQ